MLTHIKLTIMKIQQFFLVLAMIGTVVSCKEEVPTITPDVPTGSSEKSGFVHPGVFNSREELDFIKQKVNSNSQPWKSSYDTMMKFTGSSLSYTTTAYPIIYSKPEQGQPAGATADKMGTAAHAAYSHALQWVITGNQANANKSIEILNAWGGTLKEIRSGTKNYYFQNTLNAGHYTPIFVAAAEIIRHTNAGWASSDITNFQNMLLNVFYPLVTRLPNCNDPRFFDAGWDMNGCAYKDSPEFDSHTNSAGNFETSHALSRMAIGVFTGDQAIFNSGKDYWLWLIKRVVYPSGQLGEICRDCAHAEMGLIGLIDGAEIAWQQGIDLYGAENSRLSLGMEWYAKTLLGIPQTKICNGSSSTTDCSGPSDTRRIPGWEIGFNHYRNRAGKTMPSSNEVVTNIMRPEPHRYNFLSWNTLTHAILPASFNKALNKPVTFSAQQSGNEASGAVDGNLGTSWSSEGYPQWIQVDLGTTINIKKTELSFYNSRAYKYKIEVKTSSTGAYITVVNQTTNTTEGAIQTDMFTPVNVRYIKITISGCTGPTCSSDEWATINEFRVF